MNIFLLGLSVVFLVCNNIGLKLIKGEKNEKIINLVVVTGVSLIVSLIIVLCTGDEITKDMFFYGLLFGIVLVVGSICNYCAYERGSLTGTTLFNQGGLIVVVLFGIIYFKEDFNLILGLGVISMLIALTLMSMPETNDQNKKGFNVVWLLFCIVVLFANSAISIVTKFRQVNVDGKNPFAFMFICYLFSFVLSMIVYGITQIRQRTFVSDLKNVKRNILGISLQSVGATVANIIVTFLSVKMIGAVLYPVHLGAGFVITVISGVALFKEKLHWKNICGVILGVLSIILLSI